MASVTQKIVRITARRDGFRRAGIAHPVTATDYPVKAFSKAQLELLKAEPNLVVEELEVEVAEKASK